MNPGTYSLNCADWSLLSPGLSVEDVGVGRVGGSVRSDASPRCALKRSSELPIRDLGEADVDARLSPGCAVKGVENLVRRDEGLLPWLPSPQSDVAADGVATQLFYPFS